LEEHAETLIELNRQGAGVFVMVNQGDGIIHKNDKTCRTKSNVIGIRSVFIDLDEGASEKIKRVMESAIKPSIVVESSQGKYHCYWLVDDCSIEQFSRTQEAFITKYKSDEKVKDLPRVMRLPGFFHQKGSPQMSVILDEWSTKSIGLKLNEVCQQTK